MKPKLIRITTVPQSLGGLLRGQLNYMTKGFEVVGISSDNRGALEHIAFQEGIRTIEVPMTRQITPLQDLISLVKLYRVLRREKPHIVHTHTPKAGLLGMMAAYFAGVPVRLHDIAGLPLIVSKGIKRKLLVCIEKITYAFATKVYPNSKVMHQYVLENRFARENKFKVLDKISSNGVNTSYFNREAIPAEEKIALRDALNIYEDDFVGIYVGRMVRDKGVNELVKVANKIRTQYNNFKLILVGQLESDLDPLESTTLELIETDPGIHFVGPQSDVRPYYALSDLLIFPSYREGFPNVPMEAASMGLASVVSDINGCNEIVIESINGIIVPPADEDALYDATKSLIEDPEKLVYLSGNARESVRSRFEQVDVWEAIFHEYFVQMEGVHKSNRFYRIYIKRFFDLLFSLAGLLVLSPLMLVVIIFLALGQDGKVFFLQDRVGKNERIFKIIKLKTMNDKRDANGQLLPDNERLTQIGKIVRKTSLDEIPQLLNVLKGEMSLVGPRPLHVRYLPRYNDEQKRRHHVRPGITGWAQVNGRNAISWPKRFDLDIWYVNNISFILDLKIIWLTVIKVLTSEGISSETNATMEEFMGNN